MQSFNTQIHSEQILIQKQCQGKQAEQFKIIKTSSQVNKSKNALENRGTEKQARSETRIINGNREAWYMIHVKDTSYQGLCECCLNIHVNLEVVQNVGEGSL